MKKCRITAITGEDICIGGGMTRRMIYHNGFGRTLEDKRT